MIINQPDLDRSKNAPNQEFGQFPHEYHGSTFNYNPQSHNMSRQFSLDGQYNQYQPSQGHSYIPRPRMNNMMNQMMGQPGYNRQAEQYGSSVYTGSGIGVVSAPPIHRAIDPHERDSHRTDKRRRLIPAEQPPPLPYRRKLYPPNTKVKNPQPSGADPSIPQSQTLYVNNLNDRVNTDILVKDLNRIFGAFGTIRLIMALNSKWRRGQAWITFDTVDNAKAAMEALQGHVYHNQAMRINYAKQKSDFLAKEDNTYQPRERTGPLIPKAIQERESKQQELFAQMQAQLAQKVQAFGGIPQSMPTAPGSTAGTGIPLPIPLPIPVSFARQQSPAVHTQPAMPPSPTIPVPLPIPIPMAMTNPSTVDQSTFMAHAQARAVEKARLIAAQRGVPQFQVNAFNRFDMRPGQMGVPQRQNTPLVHSKTLVVTDLPQDVTEEVVLSHFSTTDGFEGARVLQFRRVAFIDYASEPQATAAMQQYQGKNIGGNTIRITYARL